MITIPSSSNFKGPFSRWGLPHLLLLVTVAELALNRLAVPALRPPGDMKPPLWHQIIDHFGLFFFYFATTLAAGVLGYQLWLLVRSRLPAWALPFRLGLFTLGVLLLGLAGYHVLTSASEQTSFVFNSCFTAMLLVLLAAQVNRDGDLGAKLGLLFLIMPLLLHYYTPFALRFIEGEEAIWGDLPIKMQEYGRWAVVLAAMASPYCFAPRPFLRSAIRLPPLAIGVFVGLVGAVILRKHYEVGMLLASRGLGVDIGPGAPTEHIALYLLALGAITWTLTSCLSAPTSARREIGVGIGLVVVGGYGFAWPLQYLVSMTGLFTVAHAARSVAREERAEAGEVALAGFRPPPINDEVWQSYVAAIVDALRPDAVDHRCTSVTIRGEQGLAITHVVTTRRERSLRLRIERIDHSIVAIDIVCGDEPPDREPEWTLYARPERILGIKAHPEPPQTSAPGHKTGDHSFDLRFRVRDHGPFTERLLDDGLRARATALIDGWLAYFPDRSLCFRVHPGRGAPLDHPIPITELAFRGNAAPPAVDRLLTLIDLLGDIGARGLPTSTPPAFLDTTPEVPPEPPADPAVPSEPPAEPSSDA